MSSSSAYFSLRAILSEEQRVPVTWETPARGVGRVDPIGSAGDIAEGDEMELPLWLAKALGRWPGKNYVSVQLPRALYELRDSLDPDGTVVRLGERSAHYYEVGKALAGLVLDADEAELLLSDINVTLPQRLELVLDEAARGLGVEDSSAVRSGLTVVEAELYSHTRNHLTLRQRHHLDLGKGKVRRPAREPVSPRAAKASSEESIDNGGPTATAALAAGWGSGARASPTWTAKQLAAMLEHKSTDPPMQMTALPPHPPQAAAMASGVGADAGAGFEELGAPLALARPFVAATKSAVKRPAPAEPASSSSSSSSALATGAKRPHGSARNSL